MTDSGPALPWLLTQGPGPRGGGERGSRGGWGHGLPDVHGAPARARALGRPGQAGPSVGAQQAARGLQEVRGLGGCGPGLGLLVLILVRIEAGRQGGRQKHGSLGVWVAVTTTACVRQLPGWVGCAWAAVRYLKGAKGGIWLPVIASHLRLASLARSLARSIRTQKFIEFTEKEISAKERWLRETYESLNRPKRVIQKTEMASHADARPISTLLIHAHAHTNVAN